MTKAAIVVSIMFGSAAAKPAQQVVDRLKARSGTWKCEGTASELDGKDAKFTGTMTTKAELDGFWIRDSFAGELGSGKAALGYKYESYSTFDTTAKKWRISVMDNVGGVSIGLADEMRAGKMDTQSEAIDSMGKSLTRDHTDVSDVRKGMHAWGENSRDGGKTWNKVYDLTCTKT